ncbi:MAG TPA: VWA domain-containing protein [Thermoanaerobaculia bacterium]|nr:VWA domain-containing protein [Thermoanaerobaculia bacterium]
MLFALLAAAAALPLSAQSQQPEAAPKLSETIDVRVINIDVVVTDRKGNPVTGLKKEDFEIYENGVKKPISNFYEVTGSPVAPERAAQEGRPAPAPAAPEAIPENQRRRIILYIDNLSLTPFNRNRVFKDMKDFVAKSMRPGDEAMVVTFNRSMKVRVPFTRDHVHVQQTLDAIAGESALGVANKSERRQVEDQIRQAQTYEEALAAARTYASQVEHDLRQSASSLSALMSTLAGVEGKKILVLTSEGFPMQPGREMFVFLDEISREKQWYGSSLLEGMGFDSSRLIEDIARAANANGITMYTVHAGGLGAANENTAEYSQPISHSVSMAAVSNTTDSMQTMAEMTGGIASINTNNFAQAFERIRRDLDSYYSLGYRAGTERVDRQRQIEVRTKNRDYVVRARKTFVEKSTHAEMNDRVIANLLYRTKANDLKIAVRTERPRPAGDDLFRVPVQIHIPMDSLTLLPQGEEYAGGFEVYVVVADERGDMSDVARRSHQVRVPAGDFAKIRGKYYSYTLDLLMEKGLNKISIGVIDTVSNETGFAKEQIIARDLR